MTTTASSPLRDAYLDLLKRAVTNYLYLGGDTEYDAFRCVTHYDLDGSDWKIDPLARPATLLTKDQLDMIEQISLALEDQRVPGDFIEAGVWRGGAIIFMRALLDAYEIKDRKVFAADSFAGIPKNQKAINDPVDTWRDRWVATLDEVKGNIARFGLLDDRIVFTPGFFADSLGALANERFSLIRLDSDSYDSVETSLDHLYPLLSHRGVVIIDDWHLAGCKMAVMDYRARHGIGEQVHVHAGNAFWVKLQQFGEPRA